mgnify:CR=1 FL=1
MTELTGIPINRDHKPGGSGTVGMTAYMAAPADGYNVLEHIDDASSAHALDSSLPNPAEHLIPLVVSQVTFSQVYIRTNETRFSDWPSFVEWVKAQNGPDVELKDETRDISTFLVTGPKSRDLLASVCNTNFSSDPFPWLTHQTLQIAGVTCVAIRVSFTGELGWELHIPVAETQKIYDHLREAGSAFQLKPFGMLALDSMRLEKGYRSWKGDLTSDYNMFDAGLRRWVHFSKPDFTGRAALAAVKDAPARTLVTLALEDPSDSDTGFGEAIYLSSVFNDASGANIAGLVLSAGYGHRTKKSLALAVLEAGEDASIGRSLAVEVVGRNRHAEIIGHGAVYDADNALLKG